MTVHLFPFFEQAALYDLLMIQPWLNNPVSANTADEWPAGVQDMSISHFLCPSDVFGGKRFAIDSVPSWTLQNTVTLFKGNYLPVFTGRNEADLHFELANPDAAFRSDGSPLGKAVFSPNRGAKIRDINDGTSNTMMVVEYLSGTTTDMRGWFWSVGPSHNHVYAWITPNSSSPDILGNFTCRDETNLPEMNLPCVVGGPSTAGSRSRHPGGVNVVLCDGSVHFISDSIDVILWRALGSIDGGELVQVP